jgi:glyceraldehyde-3-phosphate dehydrogenase (NADP+)
MIFVHKSISKEFLEKFSTKISQLKIGLPWQNADITPLPEPNKSEISKV